ncbi:phosphatidylinositol transfer protein [Nemania sp. FL0916]|nr:phosphatidylinositol transfer protein [Nemania sp. FL0916]
MRLLSIACIAGLSASHLASAGSWFGGSDVSAAAAEKVPGDSPLEFCDKDHSKDIVSIERVDLLPNPPETGAPLLIRATGTVFEPIEEGAYVRLVVKYGLIRLINQEIDLCKEVGNVDMECPVDKGVLSITKAVDIPKEVPPGTYFVSADVYNADGTPITCLQASVTFGMKTKSSESETVEEVGDL